MPSTTSWHRLASVLRSWTRYVDPSADSLMVAEGKGPRSSWLLPSHDDISEGTVGKEKRAKENACLFTLIWTFVEHRRMAMFVVVLQ